MHEVFVNALTTSCSSKQSCLSVNVPRLLLGYVVRRLVINNQVLRKIKITVENDVKNWEYISLR